MNKKLNKGFTLIELIIVIAIIGILVAVLAPNYVRYVAKARLSANKANAETAISMAKVEFIDAPDDAKNQTSKPDISGGGWSYHMYFRPRRASAIFSTGNHQKSDGQTFVQMLLLMKRKTFDVSGKSSPDTKIFSVRKKVFLKKKPGRHYGAETRYYGSSKEEQGIFFRV